MSLYIVVRHPDNKNQTYPNDWDESQKVLLSISTLRDVAEKCKTAKEVGSKVYIYRCAYGGASAKICNISKVFEAQHVDKSMSYVEFCDQEIVDEEVPRPALPGENWFEV